MTRWKVVTQEANEMRTEESEVFTDLGEARNYVAETGGKLYQWISDPDGLTDGWWKNQAITPSLQSLETAISVIEGALGTLDESDVEKLSDLAGKLHDLSEAAWNRIIANGSIEHCTACNEALEDGQIGKCESCDPREPEEDDWVTEDYRTWLKFRLARPMNTRRDRVTVSEDEDWRIVLRARMSADMYWPNCWHLSDHGNWLLLSL